MRIIPNILLKTLIAGVLPASSDDPVEHPELIKAQETWAKDSLWETGLGGTVWHYQTTPGESWDYTATQHMILAELQINGEERKVIMQAPKNGFFYVLDRESGELISADTYTPINWASHVDLETGESLWSMQAPTAILAPPVTYKVDGEQYIRVMAGAGGSFGMNFDRIPYKNDGTMLASCPIYDTPQKKSMIPGQPSSSVECTRTREWHRNLWRPSPRISVSLRPGSRIKIDLLQPAA